MSCRVGGMDQDSVPVFKGFIQFNLTLESRHEVSQLFKVIFSFS